MSNEVTRYSGLPAPIPDGVLSRYPDEWPIPSPSQEFMEGFLATQRQLVVKSREESTKPLYLDDEAKKHVVQEAVRFGILSEPVEVKVKQVEKKDYWYTGLTQKDNPLTGIDDFTVQYPEGLEVNVGDSHNWKDSCRIRFRVSANQKLDGQIVMLACEAYERTELVFLALSADLSSSHRSENFLEWDPKLTREASAGNSFPNDRLPTGAKLKFYLPKAIIPPEVLSDPAIDTLLTNYIQGSGRLLYIDNSTELRYWKKFLQVNGDNLSKSLKSYLDRCFNQE